jgi:hypothetical protein
MASKFHKKADEKLLLALACGATVEAAARQFKLSERSVYRRLADPEFRQRLREVRSDMVHRSSGMLTAAGGEAIKTMLALLKEPISPATRLGAARAVLELGMKLREVSEIDERLSALERQLGTTQPR